MWFIDFIGFTLTQFGFHNSFFLNSLGLVSIFINFVFAILIFYKALQEPQFLFGDYKVIDVKKYKTSKLSASDKEAYLQKIEAYFENDQPYLNPSLTLKNVSDSLGMPSKYISQIINEILNKNFYDFINTYRLKDAMIKLISDKDKTILEILYNSGFNSKSAFNSAFKKHTGTTPSEFRRQNRIS